MLNVNELKLEVKVRLENKENTKFTMSNWRSNVQNNIYF